MNNTTNKPNPFCAATIELAGKNLIEASAGTGKTYSVGLMALRFIIEEDVSVNDILMVTFTEAATAEMAERIRKFVREAYMFKKYQSECEDEIKKIVSKNELDENLVIERLKRAVLSLDDINVFTIHSFCQRTLNEFAFETGQAFGLDVLADESEIIEQVINKYWRENCTTKSKDELDEITRKNLYVKIKEAIKSNNFSTLEEPVKALAKQAIAIKKDKFLLSYDDMIINLYKIAEKGKNKQELINCLQNKYKAVFIDEFQDTDKFQFTIFSELFPDTPQLYIGDPKQSIYSFRGADIESYLKVQDVIKHTMNINYRSTPSIINALNTFYNAQNDPFDHNLIKYRDVDCKNKNVITRINDNKLSSISICIEDLNADGILNKIVSRVLAYITKGSFEKEGKTQIIKPSDISVLVRTNPKAAALKEKLVDKGVPTIIIDDTNILETVEATFVCNLVSLLNNPRRTELISVLTDKFISYTGKDIELLDVSVEIERIKELKQEIAGNNNNIYPVLHKLINIYHNEQWVREKTGNNYNRIKANVLQLIDVVHQKVTYGKIKPEFIPVWMKREKEKKSESGSHYEQRLESDEDAVKIMTVHKSKGLQFNIVITANFKSKFPFTIEEYRLLYVAFTRGKYKTDIISSSKGTSSNKEIIKVLQNVRNNINSENGDLSFTMHIPETSGYSATKITENYKKPDPVKIDKTWKVTSYSRLAEHSEFAPGIEETELSGYDKFVYKDMPRGADPGTFLHSLFEHADFGSYDFLDYLKDNKAAYPRFLKDDNMDLYNELMKNVLNSDLNGFKLSTTDKSKRLDELLYHLSLKDKFSLSVVNDIMGREAVNDNYELQGIIKGFIDLVFEHNGKYYVLDWKSNYLGNTLDAYDNEKMKEAIEANGYDLQYTIYAVALCRYLRLCIPEYDFDKHFGGGFWLFLRGCRQNKNTGVYFQKPDKEKIKRLDKVFGA